MSSAQILPIKDYHRRGWALREQLFRQMCQCYLSLPRILGVLHIIMVHTFFNLKIGLCALESKRPCPREAFRALPFGHRFFLWLFEKTRLPLRPCFGGFPVKLRTHIGILYLSLGNSRMSNFWFNFRRANIS